MSDDHDEILARIRHSTTDDLQREYVYALNRARDQEFWDKYRREQALREAAERFEGVTLVTNEEDWVALYKNGRKIFEGHSLTFEQGLDTLSIKFNRLVVPPDDPDKFPEVLL